MKMKFFAVLAAFVILTLAGCAVEESNGPPLFFTSILSDPYYDGDIQKDLLTGALTVTQGNTQSLFVGLDPYSDSEYRAFLDFPLTGANGLPGDAFIDSAYLDIVIKGIEPQPLIGTIPVRVELVSFSPPDLFGSDYQRSVLATTTIRPPISWADFGQHVSIDVTWLMMEAQRLNLAHFQVRIMEDLVANPPLGLIEINDTTGVNRSTLAPLLKVTYY